MRNKDYDLQHRNYYLDHPTSINHQQPYITSLENQYSVLNRSRNPYQVLDLCNFQLKTKEEQPSTYSSLNKPSAVNESLVKEVRDWDRRQNQKQNSYRSLKEEISDLSQIVKAKQASSELDKIRYQLKNSQTRAPFIPFPMLMPFGMNCQSMENKCCQHKCQVNTFRKSTPVRKYKPIKTQQQLQLQSNQKLPKQPQPNTQIIKSNPQMKAQLGRLQKKKRSNLLRRFRICAYAVYFCIYFKWFSFQFSLNRYSRFKQKYLIDSGLQITQAYKQVYKRMLEVDIPALIRQAANNVPLNQSKEDFDISTLLKHQSVTKYNALSSYKILTKNYETLFLRCAQFLTSIFKQLRAVFQNWEWDKYGESLGVGALDKTFLIDNYFLHQEIYLMMIHEGKGYAQINSQHERSQVMVKFVAKILLFNVCLQLDNNREWLQQNEKQLEEEGDKSQIFILLEISSKILFIITQLLYQEVLGDVQPNYDEVADKFRIQPCNPLVYSHSIRKRRQLFKDENLKESNLLIFGIQNLDQVNKIMHQGFFSNSNKQITRSLNNFIDFFLNKLNTCNRKLYRQLREQTLNQEYIVLRGLKKIIKSSRFLPFTSQAMLSKKSLNSKVLNSGELRPAVSKKSWKMKASNKNIQNSNLVSQASINPVSSNLIKVSIKNMIGRNR